MKKNSVFVVLMGIIVLSSCNNGGDKSAAPDKGKDSASTAASDAKKADKRPFDYVVEINHAVKDFSIWKKGFDSDSAARQSNGLGFIAIGKSESNPNSLSVVLSVSDLQKAQAFASDPRLKDVMDKNGVVSKPDISYWKLLMLNPDSKERQWVMITHKVKDFAAWQKVYDAEGTATRATYGLIDVALARNVEDSNLVQVVFDIKDMAKAKARINDPALKKLMTDGGVEGAPRIEFYNQAP